MCFIWSMQRSSEILVSSIYDCAIDPGLWPKTLAGIRDAVDAAYVALGRAAPDDDSVAQAGRWVTCNGQVDDSWMDRLHDLAPKIPRAPALFDLPVDVSWTPLTQMPEAEFKKSEFYHEWVKPQKLRDFISLNYLKRDTCNGFLTIPTSAKRDPVSRDNRRLVEQLSPHIRRAMLINDLSDHSNLATTFYRQVLDRMSAAVFVVGAGRRLTFTNSAAERLLSAGDKISALQGVLQTPRMAGQSSKLDIAIDRALSGDIDVGSGGIGVPLFGKDGDGAAAYVLPLAGRQVRGVFGPGHCVVFVTGRGEQQPMAVEMLRSMFDLTLSEARVSTMIARGEGPQMISAALGIKVNTVRTHLKHSFAKTDTSDQTALAGRINALLPPII
jgi:DNA-binding CsgD family transcriptional regulator/PAS domain-containing protein